MAGRQLYLHVGDCKAGSTILQTMLARGDCTPDGLRLFYPGQGSHAALARSLGNRPELYPGRWAAAARRLRRATWDVAVLSSELFEFAHPDRVARAIRDHLPDHAATVRVVVYVRPHAARVLSQFAENIKLGHDTCGLGAFYDRFSALGRLDYAGRLGRWRDRFGDRMIVRPFLRDRLARGDVRHDFLSVILGGAAYRLRDSGQDDNAALPVADLALMRMLQRRFHQTAGIDAEARVAFGKQFGRLLRDLPPPAPAEPLRLSRALCRRLQADCAADAARLDAEWIGAPCFVPALERACDAAAAEEQSLDAADHFAPETLRQARAWAELLQRQMTDDPRELWQRFRQSQ